jgi:hypothetical protein
VIIDDVEYFPATIQSSLVGNGELTEETQSIYNRLNSYGKEMTRVEFLMEDNGLGSLPPTISSIGSILLFNSNINPYKNYQTLDNLASSGREKTNKEEKAKGLESAPMTILSGDALPDIQGLDLMFKPSMGEMASLALPDNLPLDFIASKLMLLSCCAFFCTDLSVSCSFVS